MIDHIFHGLVWVVLLAIAGLTLFEETQARSIMGLFQ